MVVIRANNCRKLGNKIVVIVENNCRKLENKIVVIVEKNKVIKLVHWGDEMWDDVENREGESGSFFSDQPPVSSEFAAHQLRCQREDW